MEEVGLEEHEEFGKDETEVFQVRARSGHMLKASLG